MKISDYLSVIDTMFTESELDRDGGTSVLPKFIKLYQEESNNNERNMICEALIQKIDNIKDEDILGYSWLVAGLAVNGVILSNVIRKLESKTNDFISRHKDNSHYIEMIEELKKDVGIIKNSKRKS